jgi:hypothetical protein
MSRRLSKNRLHSERHYTNCNVRNRLNASWHRNALQCPKNVFRNSIRTCLLELGLAPSSYFFLHFFFHLAPPVFFVLPHWATLRRNVNVSTAGNQSQQHSMRPRTKSHSSVHQLPRVCELHPLWNGAGPPSQRPSIAKARHRKFKVNFMQFWL